MVWLSSTVLSPATAYYMVVHNYNKSSTPVLKLDAQLSVVEAGLLGYNKWRSLDKHKQKAKLSAVVKSSQLTSNRMVTSYISNKGLLPRTWKVGAYSFWTCVLRFEYITSTLNTLAKDLCHRIPLCSNA